MLEERIIRFCAPTLAGLKTGNLFNSCGISTEKLNAEFHTSLKVLKPLGIDMCLFEKEGRNPLVYVYRRRYLERDLADPEALAFLATYGYAENTVPYALKRLGERIRECDQFPHEIGLFLSYPLDDVKAFIQFGSKCCKCSGYWCVYTDEQKAKRAFARFDRCRHCYHRRYQRGTPLERLALAMP